MPEIAESERVGGLKGFGEGWRWLQTGVALWREE
jgi:hypothetical protein